MAWLLNDEIAFPDPEEADNTEHPGLVAVGGDLTSERLVAAYRSGIFPWSIDPITWWSPDPRAIFEWSSFHVSRSLRRRLRQAPYRITFDQAFESVIRECASRHTEGTWISEDFIAAYTKLHHEGVTHSVEAWEGDELAGGLYGVAIGGLFAGESMYHAKTDASKIILCHLHQALHDAGFALFDIQMLTPVTTQLGAIEIPRRVYLDRLALAVQKSCQFPSSSTS